MDAVAKNFVVKGLDSTTSTTVTTNVRMAEKLVYREEGFFGSFDYSVFLQTFTLTKLNTKQRRDKTHPRSSLKTTNIRKALER